MKDRIFFIMWGLTMILAAALVIMLYWDHALVLKNNTLLNHIAGFHIKP